MAVRAVLGAAEGGLLPGMVRNSCSPPTMTHSLTYDVRFYICQGCTPEEKLLSELVFSTPALRCRALSEAFSLVACRPSAQLEDLLAGVGFSSLRDYS
jgi:hypothetical protein